MFDKDEDQAFINHICDGDINSADREDYTIGDVEAVYKEISSR